MERRIVKKKYRCAVIGAGRIGAQFDSPESRAILTHAHAYDNHSRTTLVGFFDVDFGAAEHAAKRWSTRAYASLLELFNSTQPDIVSICVPDQYHYAVLKEVAFYSPKIVICEKPVTTTIKDTKRVIRLYQQQRIPVLVNYSRRFNPTLRKIKSELEAGKYGNVLSATALYTKGVLHNGSHAIDLARYLFGQVRSARSLYAVTDFEQRDKTVAAFLQLALCPQFYLIAGDARAFTAFEFDIICEKRRLRFTDSGAFFSQQTPQPSPFYKGYTVLSEPVTKRTAADKSLFELVGNAIRHLEADEPLYCTLEDALQTQSVCASLLQKIN